MAIKLWHILINCLKIEILLFSFLFFYFFITGKESTCNSHAAEQRNLKLKEVFFFFFWMKKNLLKNQVRETERLQNHKRGQI